MATVPLQLDLSETGELIRSCSRGPTTNRSRHRWREDQATLPIAFFLVIANRRPRTMVWRLGLGLIQTDRFDGTN